MFLVNFELINTNGNITVVFCVKHILFNLQCRVCFSLPTKISVDAFWLMCLKKKELIKNFQRNSFSYESKDINVTSMLSVLHRELLRS